jgi:DNA adenine methylase
LLDELLPLLPAKFEVYFEPFLGGAALFFGLQPATAILSDNNPDLINLYRQVRDKPESLIKSLGRLRNGSREYYRVRKKRPRTDITSAARTFYLTRLAFNGIYRLNLRGEFNVPYGRKTYLKVCNSTRIRQASAALAHAQLSCADFEAPLSSARIGDLVYLDPPYTVAHGNNGFIKYNAKIFSWADQVRLAGVANKLADKGCHVVVSNADHRSIRTLYSNFRLKTIERASVMAASAEFRRHITECIFYT